MERKTVAGNSDRKKGLYIIGWEENADGSLAPILDIVDGPNDKPAHSNNELNLNNSDNPLSQHNHQRIIKTMRMLYRGRI